MSGNRIGFRLGDRVVVRTKQGNDYVGVIDEISPDEDGTETFYISQTTHYKAQPSKGDKMLRVILTKGDMDRKV